MHKLSRLAIPLLALLSAAGAQGQSSCASDGLPQPAALVERFISADCESCWSDAKTARPGRGELALDWIVPGSRGDDAPLSAAASRDSLARLQALGRNAPAQTDTLRMKAQGASRKLRVAHGLPVNNYIGTSIELKPASGGPWKAWLLLVETIPPGTEGTPVERNLVRNVLQPPGTQHVAIKRREEKPPGVAPDEHSGRRQSATAAGGGLGGRCTRANRGGGAEPLPGESSCHAGLDPASIFARQHGLRVKPAMTILPAFSRACNATCCSCASRRATAAKGEFCRMARPQPCASEHMRCTSSLTGRASQARQRWM